MTSIRFAALVLAAVSFTACADSPLAPSRSTELTPVVAAAEAPGTKTVFHVVNRDGAPVAGVYVCPGAAALPVDGALSCPQTDAAGVATVALVGETMVIFRYTPDGDGQGERFQPGTTNRVALQ